MNTSVSVWLGFCYGCVHVVFGRVIHPGPDERRRQKQQDLMILLVIASVYKRPRTAAAPTLSSPCLRHKSVNQL